MDELREILSIGYLETDNPKMIRLGEDPWGYQCSVPEEWLKEWMDLPEGESDTREGKAWWYTSPQHQEPTTYRVENRQNVLYIDVQVCSECIDPREAAIPIDELRHLFAAEPRMVNLSKCNCFVPEAWLSDWLRLPKGEQDVRREHCGGGTCRARGQGHFALQGNQEGFAFDTRKGNVQVPGEAVFEAAVDLRVRDALEERLEELVA